MKTHHTKLRALMVLPVLAMLFLASGALAEAGDSAPVGLALIATAEVEVSQDNPDGTTTVQRIPAETVVPGDEVIYTLKYNNQGAASAEGIFITNPIPEHMELQRAAANPAGLETLYSVDGGQTYGPLSELTTSGSAGQMRQATVQDCTHIRWQFHRSLAPGESGQVSYTTRLL